MIFGRRKRAYARVRHIPWEPRHSRLTAFLAKIDLGVWNTPAAMAIAVAKAVLVITFFMEVKVSARLIWLTAGVGFFWLAILAVAVWTDVVTRVPIVPR